MDENKSKSQMRREQYQREAREVSEQLKQESDKRHQEGLQKVMKTEVLDI